MLEGRSVLVVEEEFLIALDLQRMLEVFDAGQMLFARTVAEARHFVTTATDLGMAIVDLKNADPDAIALCRLLLERKIPLAACSADARHRRGVSVLPGIPVVIKPVLEEELAAAIAAAVNR